MSNVAPEPVDVLIVDDHDIVRLGIRRLLESAGFSVAEADSGESALLSIARQCTPSMVMMDIQMPGMGGLEATRRLLQRYPRLPILILTATSDGPLPRKLLQAGAAGYITKGCSLEEMTEAIRRVRRGEKYIMGEVAHYLALSVVDGDARTPFDQLSHREMQFVVLITQGLPTQDIARTMNVSPKTVSTYRFRVMQKLELRSDAELIKLALDYGVVGH